MNLGEVSEITDPEDETLEKTKRDGHRGHRTGASVLVGGTHMSHSRGKQSELTGNLLGGELNDGAHSSRH